MTTKPERLHGLSRLLVRVLLLAVLASGLAAAFLLQVAAG